MADEGTPARNAEKGTDDELSGTVLMVGDEVAWTGPDAVLGQQEEDDPDGTVDLDDEPDVIATGEDYTPPQSEPEVEG